MRKCLFLIVMCAGSIVSPYVHAKDVIKGNYDELADVTFYGLEMKYDGMVVEGQKEDDFIRSTVDRFNRNLSGSGDVWHTQWEEAKTIRNPLGFERRFEDELRKNNIVITKNGATYTIIVTTKEMETSLFADKPGDIIAEVTIVSSETPYLIIADFGTVQADNYIKLGERVAKILRKMVYKKKKK